MKPVGEIDEFNLLLKAADGRFALNITELEKGIRGHGFCSSRVVCSGGKGCRPLAPIRRNGSCPWNFRFPSCPAHRADGIHRHWAVAFYDAATSQWKASKTETISPSLEYRSSSGIPIHAEVRGRSKGRFQ
ncbi:hypothetical protein, partial [Bilophila wadsworthia]|uniref:hypothetical protein n=1 Tax=Bilophila wadsworthia TaxID=35833 RepID=UPI00266B50C7